MLAVRHNLKNVNWLINLETKYDYEDYGLNLFEATMSLANPAFNGDDSPVLENSARLIPHPKGKLQMSKPRESNSTNRMLI